MRSRFYTIIDIAVLLQYTYFRDLIEIGLVNCQDSEKNIATKRSKGTNEKASLLPRAHRAGSNPEWASPDSKHSIAGTRGWEVVEFGCRCTPQPTLPYYWD